MNRSLKYSFVFLGAAILLFTMQNSSAQTRGQVSRTSSHQFQTESLGSVANLVDLTLLVEDFTYPAGSALTANGWTAHSAGGTNPIVTSAPSLTMTGYPGSGVGNAVSLTTSGEDDNRTFPVQTSGSVYAAFLVNVQDAAVDPIGGYFFHLGPDPVGTTFRGRVFVKKDASNNIAFGISKAATAAPDVAFTPFTYSLNTTYLLVVKYTINASTNDDTVSLFVSTNVPSTEPAPTVTATDTAAQTDINPGTVALRQGATATSPTLRVDAIRVGNSWASVTQAPAVHTQHVLDFNGDGKTDFTVTRDTAGLRTWYILYNGGTNYDAPRWGISFDHNTPADFDGDGKTDVAVWREESSGHGTFYILNSSNGTARVEDFGITGDSPKVVRDYDGDGKADVAVYRNGGSPGIQSFFFYRGSLNNPNGNVTYVPWGTGGDTPTNGDFDGDSKGDFAVRRDSGGNGVFYILKSGGGTSYVSFGLSTDAIIPGDFDGDGTSDLAVGREVGTSGNFYWLNSSNGTITGPIVGGIPNTDSLACGDYDGDGKTDVALWRQTDGVFYIRSTATGVWSYTQWGTAGDTSVGEWNVSGGQ
jgi:hypothetical protein